MYLVTINSSEGKKLAYMSNQTKSNYDSTISVFDDLIAKMKDFGKRYLEDRRVCNKEAESFIELRSSIEIPLFGKKKYTDVSSVSEINKIYSFEKKEIPFDGEMEKLGKHILSSIYISIESMDYIINHLGYEKSIKKLFSEKKDVM